MNETIIEVKPFTTFVDLNYTYIRVPREHFRIILEYIMRYKECVKVDETP